MPICIHKGSNYVVAQITMESCIWVLYKLNIVSYLELFYFFSRSFYHALFVLNFTSVMYRISTSSLNLLLQIV